MEKNDTKGDYYLEQTRKEITEKQLKGFFKHYRKNVLGLCICFVAKLILTAVEVCTGSPIQWKILGTLFMGLYILALLLLSAIFYKRKYK